jgi:2,3-bisphosphoglycerate-independent phosphoglycerate mutase
VVDVLVIPDGAAQPLADSRATAFEAADTPVLDALAAEGTVLRVATTPPGLPAGSETGIAALLGAPPQTAVGRGWIDAAAYGVAVPEGSVPWRADLVYRNGRRASVRQARDVCKHLGPGAHAVSGHRVIVVAPDRPPDGRMLGLYLRVWPGGPPPEGTAIGTTVICAPGSAAGLGRLLDATVVVPAGATGDIDTDLRAKAHAAVATIAEGASRVVVHVGGPDEAAHRRDGDGVVAVLERLDAELLGPLRDAVQAVGGRLAVCPDHGTDPATGRHLAAHVPAVVWGSGVERRGPVVMSERATADAPVVAAHALLSVAGVPA